MALPVNQQRTAQWYPQDSQRAPVKSSCCSNDSISNFAFVGGFALLVGAVLLAIASVPVASLALKHKISADVAVKVLAGLGGTIITATALFAIAVKCDSKLNASK